MFGKKKDTMQEFPDLPAPQAPSMRDYQRTALPPIEPMEEKEDIHGLPSFPDSPMRQGFSQSMIKSAIEEDKDLPELPEWNKNEEMSMKNTRTMEMEEWKPSLPQMSESIGMRPSMQFQNTNDKRPIFVKLDKFKEAKDSLVKIADKLDQMDELLKMIKDVKSKEDEEITNWEKDIENIKARIAFVNKEIFENAY